MTDSFRKIFIIGKNWMHAHLTYCFHELLIYFWVIAVNLFEVWFLINPFHATGLFRYPLTTPENRCFQGVSKETSGMKWVKSKKHCTGIYVPNDEIKTKSTNYQLSQVLTLRILEKTPSQQFLIFQFHQNIPFKKLEVWTSQDLWNVLLITS